MGYWGIGISSNNTFEDIKSDFIDLYNQGYEPLEITKRLINEHQKTINDYDEQNNFWFSIALSQWECKSLQPDILRKVESIINYGSDIELCKELGADDSEINKRETVLTAFLQKLRSERKSSRKRKKIVLKDPVFEKGDCLTYKLDNDNYGAAFVLESEKQTELGLNLIAACDYNKNQKPDLPYFEKANVLITKEQDAISTHFVDTAVIAWYYAKFYKKQSPNIEILGNMKVDRIYSSVKDHQRFTTWDSLTTNISDLEERIKIHGKPRKKLRLRKLRKKNWL